MSYLSVYFVIVYKLEQSLLFSLETLTEKKKAHFPSLDLLFPSPHLPADVTYPFFSTYMSLSM